MDFGGVGGLEEALGEMDFEKVRSLPLSLQMDFEKVRRLPLLR